MENTSSRENRIAPRAAQTVLDWAEEAVLAFVLIVFLFTLCFRVVTVSGASMAPTYRSGDRVVVLPALSLEVGDVVVLGGETPSIKRIIATEGQTVDFDEMHRTVLIDGYPLDETAFGLPNGGTPGSFASFERLRFPQTVPAGCIFVLGDNRAVSQDSRYAVVGMVDCRAVVGKAVFRLPRWED